MRTLTNILQKNIISSHFSGVDIYLRTPQFSDFVEWSNLRNESRKFLEPWEPKWSKNSLTKSDYRRRITRHEQDIRYERNIPFYIFTIKEDLLVGGVSLSNINRGITQSCSLGYWIGEKFANRGFMTEAVSVSASFVFNILKLHRLEAACIPENIASRTVLKKVGFTEEGYARKYLQINGEWKDHKLFALLSSDNYLKLN
ncbi:MAG: 30S ribosomal protein S5 alanine N-acetyltransferase [Rhodospirillaceae bacterium]|nr:30S ribosomal protein S5 alanine N-acetyltransferase [Rhodospirillaceae bacterium]|tara:strand:- start:10423 stop:11022 length:600 start_codon:yes stop_codon:yes gene_type:complete